MLSPTPRVISIRRWSPMNGTSFPLSVSPVKRASRGGTSPAPTDVPTTRTAFYGSSTKTSQTTQSTNLHHALFSKDGQARIVNPCELAQNLGGMRS